MILYALRPVPLIKILKHRIPELQNTWYADDGAAGGGWKYIIKWYELLMELGPPRGYFPEPEKSQIIVHPTKVQEAKEAFKGLKLQVHTGYRYLGGYIGDKEEEDKECIQQERTFGASVSEQCVSEQFSV